jgi:hypothetical protein
VTRWCAHYGIDVVERRRSPPPVVSDAAGSVDPDETAALPVVGCALSSRWR